MTQEEQIVDAIMAEKWMRVHPVVPGPTREQVREMIRSEKGRLDLKALAQVRAETMENMETDPLNYGYQWPWYADARRLLSEYRELLILGGNDSGKSWFGARWAVEQLVGSEEIDFAFCHSTEESSKNQQQHLVYKHLPPGWRAAARTGKFVDTTFKGKSGFPDNKFVVEQRRAMFFFYKQEPDVLTGYKLKGAWADELITVPFLEELRTRLLGRDGKLLITFTPVNGFTTTVSEFLSGAEVVEWRPSQFLPGQNFPMNPKAPVGHMPYILKCRRSTAAVICVFSEWSPFRKPHELLQLIEGKPTEYIKKRAYGWPESQRGVAFPRFSEVHILRRQGPKPAGPVPPNPWKAQGSVPALYPKLGQVGTNYCVADPGAAKNWVIKWYRCVPVGDGKSFTYLYREWPDLPTHGEWVVPSEKPDGAAGPAQRSGFGLNIIELKRMILEMEGAVWDEEKGWDYSRWEKIEERFIDPRMGGAEVPTVEDGTSIIAMMEDEHFDSRAKLVGPSMLWQPAPGGSGSVANNTGIAMMNDWFYYDLSQPLSVNNCPAFYVCEDCEQSIYVYRTYVGTDGEKGAAKDVVDPDYYLRKAEVGHVEAKDLVWGKGWSY